MRVLSRGAEAVIYEAKRDGIDVLVKERVTKRYRQKVLDETLMKSRTKLEVKLLSEARGCGVMTPRIVFSDESKGVIEMERIEGPTLKQVLDKHPGKASSVCKKIGENLGKLHDHNIMHGDLTTSNMIMSRGKIFFIDFGLGDFSERVEDKGTDLKLFRETLDSTHTKVAGKCWKSFLRGYSTSPSHRRVLERLGEIDTRGRYAKRANS